MKKGRKHPSLAIGKLLEVVPDEAGWAVDGADSGRQSFSSHDEALAFAFAQLASVGGMVAVHDRNGRVRRSWTLGREGMAKLHEVEGLRLAPELEEQFRQFDRDGTSPEERRRIVRARFERMTG